MLISLWKILRLVSKCIFVILPPWILKLDREADMGLFNSEKPTLWGRFGSWCFCFVSFCFVGGREDKGYLYIALTIPELILNIRLAPKGELSACTKEMLEMGPADGSTVPKVCSPRRELQDAFQLSHFFTYSVYLL